MDTPEIKFINTKIASKIDNRISLFNSLQTGKITLSILNVKMNREVSYRLLECASIFQEQLPFMPRSYILTQIFSSSNYILCLIQKEKIVCSLLFRPFLDANLAEIVFLATLVSNSNKGLGYLCLATFKEFINKTNGEIKIGEYSTEEIERLFSSVNVEKKEKYIYTYADFSASAFFAKQQFTREITSHAYRGLIKDYQGGHLMECTINPCINYLTLTERLLEIKTNAFDKFVRENGTCQENNKLLDFTNTLSELKKYEFERTERNEKTQLGNIMKYILTSIKKLQSAWPFLEPVNAEEVPEYYNIIKTPMDLQTMSHKIQKGVYRNLQDFESDFDLIINNCIEFNGKRNIYSRNAFDLEKKYKNLIKQVTGKLKRKI